VAILFALRILGEFEVEGAAAVCIEHFVRMERAETIDRGERQPRRELDGAGQVHVVHVAGNAQLGRAQHRGAIGRAGKLDRAKRIGRLAWWDRPGW
jgi:hypothetical protein